MPPMRSLTQKLVAAGVLTLVVILIGTMMTARGGPSRAQEQPARVAAGGNGGPFVRVAEEVLPAVVSVRSNRLFQHPAVDSLEDIEDLFDEDGMIIPSAGSGFIIDEEGLVLTNHHVVAGSASIRVQLVGGREMPATLVGSDPQTDVAVIKIDSPERLPSVRLGDSDAVRIGEWVAAVGNPMGVLEGSVTVGVVSAKKRNEIRIAGGTPSYQDFIQTDAAINFGNSGGPLVNAQGEAVGINTAFGGPGRGIGFAVSINMAREVARSLIEHGRVVRGYLGVMLQPLDTDLAAGFGLPDTRGVIIREVQPGTPAERAGLKDGDVVVTFDGQRVENLSAFRLLVARAGAGRQVPVRYVRQGREGELRVELAERPASEDEPPEPRPDPLPVPTELGLKLAESASDRPADGEAAAGGEALADAQATGDDEPMADDESTADGEATADGESTADGEATEDSEAAPDDAAAAGGVAVIGVEARSLAEAAGIMAGDLIIEVDGAIPSSAKACLDAVERAHRSGRPAIVRLRRGAGRWYTALPGKPDGSRGGH